MKQFQLVDLFLALLSLISIAMIYMAIKGYGPVQDAVIQTGVTITFIILRVKQRNG